jgi:hypothetical protein
MIHTSSHGKEKTRNANTLSEECTFRLSPDRQWLLAEPHMHVIAVRNIAIIAISRRDIAPDDPRVRVVVRLLNNGATSDHVPEGSPRAEASITRLASGPMSKADATEFIQQMTGMAIPLQEGAAIATAASAQNRKEPPDSNNSDGGNGETRPLIAGFGAI